MARNFQAKEAHDILNNKKDTETFCEFVRRFPSLSAVVLTGDIATLVKGIPFGSARQFDKAIFDIMNGNTTDSSDVSEVDNDEAEAEAENVEEKEEAPAEKPTKRGRKKSEPQPEAEEEAEEAEEEDEKPASKYAGKSSKELYMLCQKAGLKVKEKQPAEYYLEKLEYADKKAAEAAAKAKPASKAEAESDDWDDEEPAEEKPTKKAKGKAKEESDDDDWDF